MVRVPFLHEYVLQKNTYSMLSLPLLYRRPRDRPWFSRFRERTSVPSLAHQHSLLWKSGVTMLLFFVGPKPNNFAKPTSRRQCLPCRGAQPWNATARGERLHRPGDEKLHASRAIYFCGFNWPMWCAQHEKTLGLPLPKSPTVCPFWPKSPHG